MPLRVWCTFLIILFMYFNISFLTIEHQLKFVSSDLIVDSFVFAMFMFMLCLQFFAYKQLINKYAGYNKKKGITLLLLSLGVACVAPKQMAKRYGARCVDRV